MKDNIIRTAVCPALRQDLIMALRRFPGRTTRPSSAQTVGQGRRSGQSAWTPPEQEQIIETIHRHMQE